MEKPDTLTPAEVLEAYQAVWGLTQRMLEQARAAQWEALVETGAVRNQLVEKLRAGDQGKEGSPDFFDSKGAAIRNILDADAEIRKLSDDWMGELRGILGNFDVKKKIQKAYNIESL
jgi:flagellar protein FliT